MRKRTELPAKTCITCRQTFVWSKKWARNWPELLHCSDACRVAASQQMWCDSGFADREVPAAR